MTTRSLFARAASKVLFVAAVSAGDILLAENHIVYMTLTESFSPYYQEIEAGDTVTWLNSDGFEAHDATSDTGAWSTGSVAPDGSSSPILFSTPGNYPYHDSTYQFYGMIGIIAVNPATTDPATLTDAMPLAGGAFRFTITNLTAGKQTVVATSTNFSDWTAVWTNVPDGNSLSFTNPAAPDVEYQFFRSWQTL